jgi:ABC-2 type transport system permease protein
LKTFTRYLRLLYVGGVLARLHLTSYLAWIINGVFWSIILIIPASYLSPNPVITLKLLVPGIIGMSLASTGLWTGTEFLRWMVHDGLTDMFRENGMGVFHYIVCTLPVDLLLSGVVSLALLGLVSSGFYGIDPVWWLRGDPLLMTLGLFTLMVVELFYGNLAGYLYTKTRLSSSWTGILQIGVTVGTVIPASAYPLPYLAFLNPASLSAELLRASYGVSGFLSRPLMLLTSVLTPTYLLVGWVLSKKCDELIARYGLEYRM